MSESGDTSQASIPSGTRHKKRSQNHHEASREKYIDIDFTLKEIVNIHGGGSVYCISFCDIIPSLWTYFAAVGGRSASLFSIDADDSIRSIKSFTTEDRGDEFYSSCWGANADALPLLIVGGKKGIITVINVAENLVDKVLVGHGSSVNELRIHPFNHSLLFSASNDCSIRLWNLQTEVCVAIFAGEKGHTNQVITIDIHLLGNCFASAGMDACIKIWNLKDPHLEVAIEASNSYDPLKIPRTSFKTYIQQLPLFSTLKIHSDYVDSVRWVGDCILSKSTRCRVVLWSPATNTSTDSAVILQEFYLPSGENWFVKMDVCIPLDIFAVGNTWGQVFVYPLSTFRNKYVREKGKQETEFNPGEERFQCTHPSTHVSALYHQGSSKVNSSAKSSMMKKINARHSVFSPNGQYVVSCFDSGAIQLWKLTHHFSGNGDSKEK